MSTKRAGFFFASTFSFGPFPACFVPRLILLDCLTVSCSELKVVLLLPGSSGLCWSSFEGEWFLLKSKSSSGSDFLFVCLSLSCLFSPLEVELSCLTPSLPSSLRSLSPSLLDLLPLRAPSVIRPLRKTLKSASCSNEILRTLDASCSTAVSTSIGLSTVGGFSPLSCTAGRNTSQSTSTGLRTEGGIEMLGELFEGLVARMEVNEATLELEVDLVDKWDV